MIRAAATENGTLKYGLYDFSFGYKTGAGAGNFYTVMAYGDTGQTSYRIFSNPRSTFCTAPCGVENNADNARSLRHCDSADCQFQGFHLCAASTPEIQNRY